MATNDFLNNNLIVFEAEDLKLDRGFYVSNIDGTASGGKIIRVLPGRTGTAAATFSGQAGTYRLTLDAYDENDGRGQLFVKINGQTVRRTVLDKNLGQFLPTASNRIQIVIDDLTLNPGDKVEIVGVSNGNEYTSIDKLSFEAMPPVTPEVPGTVIIEAEDFNLNRNFYVSRQDRGASGGNIIRARAGRTGVATTRFEGVEGNYRLALDAYDENDGNGRLTVKVNGTIVNTTVLNQNLGSRLPNAATRVQLVIDDLALNRGDVIQIEGRSDRYEYTSVDKLTFTPVQPAVEIISNGGGGSAVVTVDEGVLAVTDVNVNVGDDNVVYSINMGADKDLFTLDPITGQLSFINAPDWEKPLDVGGDNVYEVNVIAAGATSGDGQFLSIVVADVENPDPTPVGNPDLEIINSAPSVLVQEGKQYVTDININGEESGVLYLLNDGADKDLFDINPVTGVLSFKHPPDWENPLDSGEGNATAGDNNYEVNILAIRGAEADSKFLTVTVADVIDETADPVSVYLLGGQSNLEGEAEIANLSDPTFLSPFPPAQIWSVPNSAFVDLASGFDGQTDNMGPELSFGRRIVELSNDDVYLVKYGLGSTSLAEDWNPDGTGAQYNTFVNRVDAALADLTRRGIAYEVDGLVWQQGESDTYTNSFAPAYEDNLTNFIGRVRDLYGDDLAVSIGLLRNDLPTSPVNRDLVRAAQQAVADATLGVSVVDTDALGSANEVLRVLQNDLTHYNADGQIALGNAHAESFFI